jgi:hypothetical protein
MANAPIINRPRFRISRYSFLTPPSQQNAAMGQGIDLNANAIRQNTAAIQTINASLSNIGGQIALLNKTLVDISTQVRGSALLDQIREQEKQKRERILAEQAVRDNKESGIERKVQSALAKPLQKIGQKAQGVLGRLGRFFTILLAGFLGGQALKFIGGLITGNENALKEVRDTLLRNLKFIIPIFLTLTGTLGIITRSLVRLGFRIAGSAFRNLLMRPISYLLRLAGAAATSLLNGVRNTPLPGRNQPGRTQPGRTQPGGNQGGRNPGRRSGGGGLFGAIITGVLGSTLPGYQAQGGLGQIINSAIADPITGTILSTMIPGGLLVRTILGTAIATGQAGRVADMITGAGSDATNTQLQLQEQQDNININLIPTTTGGSQEIGAVDGNANDIPLINTTNRDNFYLMYSMIQYNIQPS